MNKKGFTIIELLASFAITMVIAVFLLQIVLDVKDIYYNTSLKTQVNYKQSIFAEQLYQKTDELEEEYKLTGLGCANNSCTFTYTPLISNGITKKYVLHIVNDNLYFENILSLKEPDKLDDVVATNFIDSYDVSLIKSSEISSKTIGKDVIITLIFEGAKYKLDPQEQNLTLAFYLHE